MSTKKPKPPHVWIVEILKRDWEPYVRLSTRKEALSFVRGIAGGFRIRKYVRQQP